MRELLPHNLIALAQSLPSPLYVVGGAVRDFVAGFCPEKYDYDLSSANPVEEVIDAAEKTGIHVCAVYKNTGTVKLQDNDPAHVGSRRHRRHYWFHPH